MPATEVKEHKSPSYALIQRPTMLPERWSNWFWRNARKVVVAVFGGTLLLLGMAMIVLPGPGWVTIFAGLGVLATEFAWARWVLKRAREQFNHVVEAAKNGIGAGSPRPPTDLQ